MTTHGTYSAYAAQGCRCGDCGKANSEYERRRVRLKATGRFPWK